MSAIRALLLALAATAAAAPRSQGPDVDRLAIASRLVQDGHWDRAAAVLAEVAAPRKGEEARFHLLSGMVALELGRSEQAALALEAAVAAGAEPLAHVWLARARMALSDPAAALTELDRAGEAASSLPGAAQLRARALRQLGEDDAAYQALLDGRLRFPDHAGLVEDQLALLVDLGLTRRAVELGAELLGDLNASETAWVGLGDRLRRAGALDDALSWLEEARLRFPDSIDARVALASACLEAERPLCCGEVLQEAAALDNRYASEAAECFRQAELPERALYLNGLVADDTVKVRQRLGLLLQLGAFDQAAALDARLSRLGLLDSDEHVAYALAYAHFRNGSTARAEQLLSGLRDPELFRQATALREAMASEGPR